MYKILIFIMIIPFIFGVEENFFEIELSKTDGKLAIENVKIISLEIKPGHNIQGDDQSLEIVNSHGKVLHKESLTIPEEEFVFLDELTDEGLVGSGKTEKSTFKVYVPYTDQASSINLYNKKDNLEAEHSLTKEKRNSNIFIIMAIILLALFIIIKKRR